MNLNQDTYVENTDVLKLRAPKTFSYLAYLKLTLKKETIMTTYTLTVKNESLSPTRFAIFQEAPELGVAGNVFTLAWFSKFAYTGTTAEFAWEIDYSAIWSRPGQKLRPGVVCKTSQDVTVDLDGPNKVTLSYDQSNDAFYFGPTTIGSKGSIFTNCDSSVPNSLDPAFSAYAAGVGVAMSGAGTFLVNTQPNINLTWTPKPKYYLVSGNFKSGEILDVQNILNGGKALEIPYESVLTQTAYLDKNNILHLK
ncbi:hypothetical protein MSP8887_03708 [Marinomonas spartinae]|uniref:hypothetical protein n=1 Tax=Marinomonas spartinae TaxID=1792290 RepID=UPI0008090599|nr:hypothetical protein [Marinomonas spartinae]SBS39208.1 hypothetical protein MSP8887_03708 [Marinomonas spartinae]